MRMWKLNKDLNPFMREIPEMKIYAMIIIWVRYNCPFYYRHNLYKKSVIYTGLICHKIFTFSARENPDSQMDVLILLQQRK